MKAEVRWASRSEAGRGRDELCMSKGLDELVLLVVVLGKSMYFSE